MAKIIQRNIRNANIARFRDVVISDGYSKEVMRISNGDITIRYGDGRIESLQQFNQFVLCDGTVFHLGLTADPSAQLGVCHFCRYPDLFECFAEPTHGLIRLDRSITCTCGTLCCVSHAREGSDGVWRCVRCAKRFAVKNTLLNLFFTKE